MKVATTIEGQTQDGGRHREGDGKAVDGGRRDSGAAPPAARCDRRYDAVTVVAMVLSRAVPIDPPTCWVELIRALATPAFAGATPTRAVLLTGTNTMPMPKAATSSAGNRWSQ